MAGQYGQLQMVNNNPTKFQQKKICQTFLRRGVHKCDWTYGWTDTGISVSPSTCENCFTNNETVSHILRKCKMIHIILFDKVCEDKQ